MRRIHLTKGLVTIVDDIDYEWLSAFNWYAHKSPGGYTFYACRKRRKSECPDTWKKNMFVSMHKEIMKTPSGMHTDHVNGNGLDNRRQNLRIVTPSQNLQNARLRRTNKSGSKGVSWDSQTKKWRAWICLNGQSNTKFKSLGRFKTIKEAIKVRQEAEKEHFIQPPV
jgi:hypothetical protein